jgi:5-formyltetrahydrofolate cyclo-ligase
MTAHDASDPKQALRASIAERVRGVRTFARAVRAERLAATVLRAPALAGARLVLCYRAMPDEIDVDPLVRALAARGVRVAFPHVTDKGAMWMYAIDSREPLAPRFWVRDRYGIAAPDREAPGVARVFPREIDAVVVPGRAFDARGARLGRGKGYYDRLIARLRPDARGSTVGVCFREQLVDCVPEDARDRRVACVAAEGRLIRGSRAGTA